MRPFRKLTLKFFQDDATGDWGVTNEKTIQSDTSFNAFWRGLGIFHDVWEHWFEYEHPYFRGSYALNVAGEMAAMGHALYFYDLGIPRTRGGGYYYFPDIARRESYQYVQEAIQDGSRSYGTTLEVSVPKQKPVVNGEVESQIYAFWKDVKELEYTGDYEEDKEPSEEYKKSVTFRKIADAHRWGYRQAEKAVPRKSANIDVLIEFMDFWEEFTKKNDAMTLAHMYRCIEFRLYRKGGIVSWKAKLISADYEIEDVDVRNYERY